MTYLEIVSNDVNAGLQSFKIDTSAIHGKFIGDTWFGGCSWTTDERYFAYVAMTKQAEINSYFTSGKIDFIIKYMSRFIHSSVG